MSRKLTAAIALGLAALLGAGCASLREAAGSEKPAWELPPPPPNDAPVVDAGRLHRATLENGLEVLVLEDPRLPRVRVGLAARAGAGLESPVTRGGLQLLSVERQPVTDGEAQRFPFSVPAIRALGRIELESPVTFFVGENGSGKSTLLEALAAATALPTVGTVSARNDRTLAEQRKLARRLRLAWSQRSHRGFFLRAEDFFGFTARVREMKEEFSEELARIDVEYEGRSDYAKTLAKGPARGSIHALEERYGSDLDHNSHGEGFLQLFRARLVAGGLYLLDEPEAALSPQSQLAFIAMLKDAVDAGSQFVIATHSPILMAVPGARILSFDESPPAYVAFEAIEHVNLMREFLASPERFLRHIWTD